MKGMSKITIVNLETKTMIVNGFAVITDGVVNNNRIFEQIKPASIDTIEELYHNFKHSVPSEDDIETPYFKALALDELSDEDLANNINRQTAREKLESTLLVSVLAGTIVWGNPKRWFWQSPSDEDLIILRKWVEC